MSWKSIKLRQSSVYKKQITTKLLSSKLISSVSGIHKALNPCIKALRTKQIIMFVKIILVQTQLQSIAIKFLSVSIRIKNEDNK